VALIKHRPKLGLRAPSELRPGREATGYVVVNAKRAVPIESITVSLKGEERVTVASGKSSRTFRVLALNLRADLSGPREVPPGRHELPFTFTVPPHVPASYSFGWARVEYYADVRVDIDWWPDAVAKFILNVGHPKAEPVEPRPQIYSTAPEGPVGNQPVLEVSLATDTVPLGGTLDVAVGIANADTTRFRGVRVAIVALETRFDDSKVDRGTASIQRYQIQVPMLKATAGLPFRIQLPDVPPTIRSRLFHLDWALDVVGVVAFGSDVAMRVPLVLVPKGGVRIRQRLAPAPVGSPRERSLWEAAARDHGMSFDGQEMRAKVGDAEVSVRLGHRKKGVVLVGEVTYPDLHLDLDGGAKGSFHRLLKDSVDVDNPRFSESHYVTGRDPGQVRAFVAGLREWILVAELDDLSDERVTFVTRQRTQQALVRMCRIVQGLARRVPFARNAVPAPRGLEEHGVVWQGLANREGATFERARMALHFPRGEDRAVVITEWDGEGEPYRTTVALGVRDPVDDDYHFLSTDRALGADEAQKYGADARQLLARLVEETPHVRVEKHALVAHLEPELEDPARAVSILKRLEALYVLLRGAAGPYR